MNYKEQTRAAYSRAVARLEVLREQRTHSYTFNGKTMVAFTTKAGKDCAVPLSVFDGWIKAAEVDVGITQGRVLEMEGRNVH